ncbi:MAG: A/G-specific adenine glycosylase [Verrucomicrobiota bacterium]
MNSLSRPAAFRRALLAWYRENGRDLPWRRTTDPYAILVSEFMLQQTQVATVLSYYKEWLRRFPDLATLAAASEREVLHAWQGLGYYARARNLHALAKTIHRQGGPFPRDPAELRGLPGIGRYTANAVAAFAFNQSVPLVEANIARVIARLFGMQEPIDTSKGCENLWHHAAELLPPHAPASHHSAMMDLGALVCRPRVPQCPICPVRKFCRAPNPVELPRKKPRPSLEHCREHHDFIFHDGRILLEQSQTRWRGLWILPRRARARTSAPALHVSQFPFTHHRITLAVFPASVRKQKRCERWFSLPDLESVALPSPHRRALTTLISARTQNSGNPKSKLQNHRS